MMQNKPPGRKRRARLVTAIAVAATIALTGCATAGGNTDANPSTATEKVRVAYVGSKSSTFEQAAVDGLSSVDGITVDFFEVGYDENKQQQAIDDAIVSGKYQGIITVPRTATGVIPAAERAIEAGLQFVSFAAVLGADDELLEVQIPGQAAAITPDNNAVAELQWEMALQYCDEEGIEVCNIARVGAVPANGPERIFARVDVLEAEKAGERVNRYDTVFAGGWDSSLGLTAGQDLFTAHPDVDVVIGADVNLAGVAQAAANANKQVGFVGEGGSEFGVKQVRDGTFYGTVAHFPFYQGHLAGEAVLRHVADPTLDSESITEVVPDGVEQGVTKENVDSFEPEYEL